MGASDGRPTAPPVERSHAVVLAQRVEQDGAVDVRLVLALVLGPVLSALALVVSHAAASGRIPRNHLAGIRLPALMVSDEAWRAGHRGAVLPATVWTIVMLGADVLVLALLGVIGDRDGLPVGLLLLLLAGLVWIGVAATRAAMRERSRG